MRELAIQPEFFPKSNKGKPVPTLLFIKRNLRGGGEGSGGELMDIPNKWEKQQLPSPRKLDLKVSFMSLIIYFREHCIHAFASHRDSQYPRKIDYMYWSLIYGRLGGHRGNTHGTWTFCRSHYHHKQLLSRIWMLCPREYLQAVVCSRVTLSTSQLKNTSAAFCST